MRALNSLFAGLGLLLIAAGFCDAFAAGAVEGGTRQGLNVTASIMFFIFVAATVGMT